LLPYSYSLVHSCCSPFSITSSLPLHSFSRKMLAHIVLVVAAAEGRNLLPVRTAIPACAIASSSPAPDSPMVICYAMPRSYFQQMNAQFSRHCLTSDTPVLHPAPSVEIAGPIPHSLHHIPAPGSLPAAIASSPAPWY
jgi:hypothetical protein